MALIKCDECGREISSKSLFCPGCGYPTHLNSALGGAVPEPEALKQIREQLAEAQPQQPAAAEAPVEPEKEPQQPVAQPEPRPEPMPEPEQPSEPEQEDVQEPEQPSGPSRRNERIKVWLFLGVFLILLGTVLYFYFTAPVEPMEDESVADEIEAVEDAASDSIAADAPDMTDTAATLPSPAASGAATAPAVKPRPEPLSRPAARPAADEVREIKVAPLSEQAGAVRHDPVSEPDGAE